jgi:hypothetical protein
MGISKQSHIVFKEKRGIEKKRRKRKEKEGRIQTLPIHRQQRNKMIPEKK